MKQPLNRLDVWIALIPALVAFFLYARTLVPGLIPNDSAEFQTLAYVLQHAHTTGYAVYLILARLFVFLPLGEVAFEVNLFSALMGALTVGFVFLCGRLLSGSRSGGLIGSAVLAVAPTFWSQSIIAEVYTAGSAFTAGALLTLIWWWQTRSPRLLFTAVFLIVLGYGVHGSVILTAPAAALLVLLSWQRSRKRFSSEEKSRLRRENLRGWLPGVYGALAGLAFFLLAFLIVDARDQSVGMVGAAYQPSISRFGGQPEDIDSIGERFAFLVFARQWRSAMFENPAEDIPHNFNAYMHFYWQDTTLFARLLVWVGLVLLLATRWRLGLFFLALIAVHWLYTFNYRIGDIFIFFLSLYVYYALLIAEAAGKLLSLVSKVTGGLSRFAKPLAALVVLMLVIWEVFQPSLSFLQRGEARWDFMNLPSNSALAQLHTEVSLNVEALPQNAVVLAGWYNLYMHAYVAHVEQDRRDVRFLEAYPYAMSDRIADTLVSYLKDLSDAGRPLFMLEEYPELGVRGFRITQRFIGAQMMYALERR